MSAQVLGGRYQVQDKIGAGGMASVYRGRDEVLGRTVAIKTMLPQYAADPSFAARFKQEAQAAAALQSPYIVSVYDWGKDGDIYFIVMEYLRGTDLKTGIRTHGAVGCKKVAQIGSEIAQALAVAHKHDIIHRDIKPQNIMVLPDGNIKVMDFGIARAKNSHLTTDNSVLGTAHYVSPEQTQGKELGPTTDIYSLGIVMYEAATGRVPFEGDDAISVALKQVSELPKPPSELNSKIDPNLEAIILKCMQKNPADRFQSAEELTRALRDYLAGRMSSVAEQTRYLGGAGQAVTTQLPANGATATMPATQVVARGKKRSPQSATELKLQQDEQAEKSKKSKRTVAIIVALIALLALGIGAFAIFQNASQTYEVPNLMGKTQDEAEQVIRASGHFTLGQIKESYSSSVDEGKVMEQSPNAGRKVADGTAIDLVISKGETPAASVTVPDLKNMTPTQAMSALSAAGLKGQAGDSVASDDVEVGRVATQDQKAGDSVKAGSTVTYHLSTGPDKVVVPSVAGDTEAQARAALEDAGFVVQVQKQSSSSVAEGKVISTNPAEGSSAAKGATITVIISSGQESIQVPNVIGKDYMTAQSILRDKGFLVDFAWVDSKETKGVVLDQSPTGSVAPGTKITIKVSNASLANSGNSGGNNGSNKDE